MAWDCISSILLRPSWQPESRLRPNLFISDGLHLSDAGYAIWAEEIREHLEATVPKFSAVFDPLEPGTTLLVDLGPGNPEDGLLAPSPDGFGRHWNSWHPVEANTLLSSGEHLGSLVTTSGEATSLRLTFSGATKFSAGLRDGGLLDPSEAFLGDLAVPEAPQIFFMYLRPARCLSAEVH